jgi:UDP-glucose 4-epimerase
MKALVTGAAGFIGSTLSERLIRSGADVVGIDCFTDYYPRPLKERNLANLRSAPKFQFVESRIQDADLPSLLADRTHVFHLAAQAGVRKSWGKDFEIYTVNNIEATQVLLEACVGRPIDRLVYASSSSVYGDNVTMPMREDAFVQPVSPYGVSKLAAEQLCYLYFVNHRVPTVSLRYFTSTVPASARTWASTSSCGRPFLASPLRCSATASRRAISPSWTMRQRDHCGG